MRIVLAILAVLILSTSVSAWDLNLVESRILTDTTVPAHLGVILSGHGDVAGYSYSHKAGAIWRDDSRFVVDLIGDTPIELRVSGWLRGSVSIAQPDGQYYFYLLTEVNMPKAQIFKAAMKPHLALIDSAIVVNDEFYRGGAPMDEYRYELSLVDSMVIFEEDRRERIWDGTIGFEENRRVQSTALNFDLTEIIQWPGRSLRPFFNNATQSHWWGYVHLRHDYYNTDYGSGSSSYGYEGIVDTDKNVVLSQSLGQNESLVESGDLLTACPGEEIVYNSPTPGILFMNPDGWSLSYYYVDGDSIKQAWYTPSHRYEKLFHYQARNLLVGLSPSHQFHLFDAATGTLLETIPVNPDIIFYDFHVTAPPTERLLIVGREANELLLYEFAEFTDIDDTESDITLPANLRITAAWPNPFNANVNIMLNVPSRSRVTVEIVNLLGQVVASIHNGALSAGEH